MEIRHLEKINCTPAVPLALDGWRELIERGLIDNTVLLGWDNKAFVAEEDGELIGCLLYSESDWKDAYSVQLGYVKPAHRRKGIYRALWQALVAQAREKKRVSITGITSTRNAEMQKTMAALGRVATYITYEFRVEPAAEAD